MYTIKINEHAANKLVMANILRDIADELERGESIGDEFDWSLYGQEYIYTPAPDPEKLPNDFSDELLKNAAISLYNGSNKLAVIKFVKFNTGCGLKEAKDYCDELLHI